MPREAHRISPDTPPTAPGRRRVLLAGAAGLAAASASACDLLSTDPTGARGAGRKGSGNKRRSTNGKEAPSLAEQVKQGKLPPVDQRLPDKPMTVQPVERVGVYGGDWHSAVFGPSNSGALYCTVGYDNLVRWTRQWKGKVGTAEIAPNIAESYDIEKEGARYTFRLRKGMKWSDGKPFTADDVVFAVRDVLLNTELTPVTPSFLATGSGKPATIDKVDDQTFTVKFPEPFSMFLQRLATPAGDQLTSLPLHYMRRFHKRYNPNVDKLVKESGESDWVAFFLSKKAGWGESTQMPTLQPWHLVTPFSEGPRVVYERNPYYWKVDPKGSQLPYLDRVLFAVTKNAQVMLLKATSGEIDLEAGPDTRFTDLRNKPVLARSRKKGGYRFVDVTPSRCNVMVIHLNQNHKDPAMREIFQNKDFRVGLSHAINRDELVAATMQRLGEPYQMAPLPDSAFYDKGLATQYLDHNLAKANEYLDRTGWSKKNGDGIRLGPDGKPITFKMNFVTTFRPEWADMLDYIKGYWRKVGVDMSPQPMDRTLFGARNGANKFDAAVWQGEGGLDIPLSLAYYAPVTPGNPIYATLWGKWYDTHGKEGEEPPAAPKRQMELFDRFKATIDPAEQRSLMEQILAIAKDQFYIIGVARETQKYFIAKNHFHNVPEPLIQSWIYPTPGPTEPCQYFREG